MKYARLIGSAALLLVVVSSFLPWAYYPDLHEVFTGFFSEQNQYGKPGKVLLFLSAAMLIFFWIPRMWAKRANQFMAVLLASYAVKCLVLYTGCYQGFCPSPRFGLFLLMIGAAAALTAAMLRES